MPETITHVIAIPCDELDAAMDHAHDLGRTAQNGWEVGWVVDKNGLIDVYCRQVAANGVFIHGTATTFVGAAKALASKLGDELARVQEARA